MVLDLAVIQLTLRPGFVLPPGIEAAAIIRCVWLQSRFGPDEGVAVISLVVRFAQDIVPSLGRATNLNDATIHFLVEISQRLLCD